VRETESFGTKGRAGGVWGGGGETDGLTMVISHSISCRSTGELGKVNAKKIKKEREARNGSRENCQIFIGRIFPTDGVKKLNCKVRNINGKGISNCLTKEWSVKGQSDWGTGKAWKWWPMLHKKESLKGYHL